MEPKREYKVAQRGQQKSDLGKVKIQFQCYLHKLDKELIYS